MERHERREWQDVEFNDAADMGPHLRVEDGIILVDHASLLSAMTRTNPEDWRQFVGVPVRNRKFLWFSNQTARLVGRVEDDRGVDWAAHVWDSHTVEELATLAVYLDASLLLPDADTKALAR